MALRDVTDRLDPEQKTSQSLRKRHWHQQATIEISVDISSVAITNCGVSLLVLLF